MYSVLGRITDLVQQESKQMHELCCEDVGPAETEVRISVIRRRISRLFIYQGGSRSIIHQARSRYV